VHDAAVAMSARLDVLAPFLIDHLLNAHNEPEAMRAARLLARAELGEARHSELDAAMLAWFGHEAHEGVASVSAADDFGPDFVAAHWLRADPVHLRADATRVILFDVDSVGLDADESDALLAHLNAGFADGELHFERARAPTRWYVRMNAPVSLALASPRSLRGHAVEDSLSALRRAGALNRLMTEAQMLLYEAPTNLARAAAGRAPINSVWFWGGGTAPILKAGSRVAVLGDDALLAACARHAGIALERDKRALRDVLRTTAGDVLLLDHVEADGFDINAFAREILAPACAALASGRLATLVIHDHERELAMTRAARWRLWRRAGVFLDTLRRARDDEAR
jgi:hypothetical protein